MLTDVDKTWTLGTHICFRNLGKYWGGKTHKTNVYTVTERRDASAVLGHISWFPRWRKYVFESEPAIVYEETCLRDIAEFVARETAAYKMRK